MIFVKKFEVFGPHLNICTSQWFVLFLHCVNKNNQVTSSSSLVILLIIENNLSKPIQNQPLTYNGYKNISHVRWLDSLG